MTSAQRVIKYFAIALAMMIIFSIASGAFGALTIVTNLFSGEEVELQQTGSFLEGDIDPEVSVIDIEVNSVSVWVKSGNKFKFETNNESIKSKITKEKLTVTQKSVNFLDSDGNNSLIIYVPEDIKLLKLSVSSAAGNVLLDGVFSQKINLDLGAGELKMDGCKFTKGADIDTGMGKASIENCVLRNLDLDIGVGKLTMTSYILGKSNIDCGIGQTEITLKGKAETYCIHAEKGIGLLTVNGNSIADEGTYGDGDNKLDVDAGIGNVKIEFYNK